MPFLVLLHREPSSSVAGMLTSEGSGRETVSALPNDSLFQQVAACIPKDTELENPCSALNIPQIFKLLFPSWKVSAQDILKEG